MKHGSWRLAVCLPLLLTVAACGGASSPTPAATQSDPPCTTELCRTYERGYGVGEAALTNEQSVTLTEAEKASLPVSDGTAAGAMDADMAVVHIFCERETRKHTRTLDYETSEEREAYLDGCLDGATPFVSIKLRRGKYDGTSH